MPTYSYYCSACECSFELFFSIHHYQPKPRCIQCDKRSHIERDYRSDVMSQNTSIKKTDSELSTIGDLANRNRDRLSDDEKIALHKKHNSYKDAVSNKELPKGMSRMKKPSQKTKWRNL